MSEALSIANSRTGFLSIFRLALPGSAFSPEAKAIRELAAKVVGNFERSQALFGEKLAAIGQLGTLANECGEENWDGCNACAMDPRAVRMAENFVRALPRDVALPEFAPEPDGSVSLDWIRTRNLLLSMSISRSNRLGFTWLNGTDNGYAVEFFDGSTVPSLILQRINAIMNDGNASVRVD